MNCRAYQAGSPTLKSRHGHPPPPDGHHRAPAVRDRACLQREGEHRAASRGADGRAGCARPEFRGRVRRRRQPRRRRPRRSAGSRRATRGCAWSASAATSVRRRPCRPGSTTAAATSSSSWMATCRTTRTTFRGCSRRSTRATTSSAAGARTGRTTRSRSAALADRQLDHRARHRRAPARLRLHAQGLPPRRHPGREAVRRDAPLHPRVRVVGRAPASQSCRSTTVRGRLASPSTRCRAPRACCSTS